MGDYSRLEGWIFDNLPEDTKSQQDLTDWLEGTIKNWGKIPNREKDKIVRDWEATQPEPEVREFLEPEVKDLEKVLEKEAEVRGFEKEKEVGFFGKVKRFLGGLFGRG